MKISDRFFGVHSLLSIVQGFRLNSLHFTKRCWSCLWQYGEMTSCEHLSDKLCSSLPGLSHLTSLTIPYVADDNIVNTVSRYLNNLTRLDMSNSNVTDKGLTFFKATSTSSNFKSRYLTRSAVRKLEEMIDDEHTSKKPEDLSQLQTQRRAGCPKLEHLNIESCDNVTEKGVMFVIEQLVQLRSVEYHQKSSVLEILIKWSAKFTDKDRSGKALSLMEVEHSFPYDLSSISDHMSHLSILLPRLTTITLVTTDASVSLLAMFPSLSRITL